MNSYVFIFNYYDIELTNLDRILEQRFKTEAEKDKIIIFYYHCCINICQQKSAGNLFQTENKHNFIIDDKCNIPFILKEKINIKN